MKIFYFPVHTTLEFDEITLFTELGYEVFSVGLYGDSENVESNFNQYAIKESRYAHRRPFSIPNYKTNPGLLQEFKTYPENTFGYDTRPFKLSKAFLDSFDIFYVNHNSALCKQFKTMYPDKLVIFNTISQSDPFMEQGMRDLKSLGVKIIRFFESEKTLANAVEQDELIPQFVDENEFNNWTGSQAEVLAVCRGVPSRPVHTNAKLYLHLTQTLPIKLIGPGNEGMPNAVGNIDYEALKEAYRSHRVFFNLGTKPAGLVYTTVEALMTGCPVVSVGKELGGSRDLGIGYTNAVPNYITNGLNGFYSDDVNELVANCKELLNNESLAKKMSVECRKLAMAHFSKDIIKNKWKKILSS